MTKTMKIIGLSILVVTLSVCAFTGSARAQTAGAQTAGFPDVPPTHWAAQAVAKLAGANIITGYGSSPLQAASPGQAKPAAKPSFDGNKPVTRYELAITLYRFVQYIERANARPKSKGGASAPLPPATSGADAVRRLIAGGFLPKNTPLANQGDKTATTNELVDALTSVIAKNRENATPITPESLRTYPQEKSHNAPGT
jgi:hypothetical protein